MTTDSTALANLEAAARLLALAETLPDIKDIRDKAEAMRQYARQAKLGLEAQNRCAELKLRAERKAGELLAEMEKNPGGQAEQAGYRSDGRTGSGSPPTLADLGIKKNQSSAWQRIASVPAADFEAHIDATKAAGKELTTTAALKLAPTIQKKAEAAMDALVAGDPTYRAANLAHSFSRWCDECDRVLLHDAEEMARSLPPADFAAATILPRLDVWLADFRHARNGGLTLIHGGGNHGAGVR